MRDLKTRLACFFVPADQADAALETFFAAVDSLELSERSIIVFLSEHGDLFGEHGR